MAGGIGHTLPFLISDFHIATIIAVIVVVIELEPSATFAIAIWIRLFGRRRFSVVSAACSSSSPAGSSAVRNSGECQAAGAQPTYDPPFSEQKKIVCLASILAAASMCVGVVSKLGAQTATK